MLNETLNASSLEAKAAPAGCCSGRKTVIDQPASPALPGFLITYQPIFMIAGSALLGSLALPADHHGEGGIAHTMSAFMGLFLFPLALLKLFDVSGFAKAFARYDITARFIPGYALAYPFLEMALAIGFLSGVWPDLTHFATLVIGIIGTAGIVRTLNKGEQVQCACVGSMLKVPLGSVSIAENAGMAGMAALLLVF